MQLGLQQRLDGHQAIKSPVEKQQIQREVPAAHLQGVFAADKAEIAAQFDQKVFKLMQQTLVQIGLKVTARQVQKLDRSCP